MKITGLNVDGYGVWTGLTLDGLSDGLNVFHGPNEAGKTTLMQFVRSVLHGFTPSRQRYLPPIRGGEPGGSVDIAGANGHFQISRHANPDALGGPDQVTLMAADGTRQGEHLLKVLLCNIDEQTFNNVFAVGLREMQELGTLGDTEAASLLYNLSAGLDRVALVDVMRELDASRKRLLGPEGQPSQILQLLAEREKLRAEIEDSTDLTRRYTRIAARRNQIDRESGRLEEENNRLGHEIRVIRIAMTLGDRWRRRAELDNQLLAFAPIETMPEGAVERLDAVNAAVDKRKKRVDELNHRWEQLRREAHELKINEPLWRLAPRIEALAEQEAWIGTLENQIEELEPEIPELQRRLTAEQEQLGLSADSKSDGLPSITSRTLAALRPRARALRLGRKRRQEAQEEAAAAGETVQSLVRQIDEGLAARGQRDLDEAVRHTGDLAARLRRRVQADERLKQMDDYQAELEQQSRRLLDRQVLPVWILMGLGAMFVVGVMMMMAGFFMPESIIGSLGWPIALLGMAGIGVTIAAKYLIERSNAKRLEACQKQISMLQVQIQQAQQQRDLLDKELPSGGVSVADRLQAAQEELAALEGFVSLDADRRSAEQEAAAADGRARQATGELETSLRAWRESLVAAGLPKGLSPKQVRDLAARRDQLAELERRLATRREEHEHRCRELAGLAERIVQLASAADVALQTDHPIGQIRELTEQLAEQETRFARRDVLRAQARQIKRKRAQYGESIDRLKRRRRGLLDEVGVDDEQELRQRAVQIARASVLRDERESLQREIDAAIAGYCPEEAVREQLEGDSGETLQAQGDRLEEQLQTGEAELQERFEQRGELNEQLKTLADDRLPAIKQLELATVQKRLDDAVRRWQVLAVTNRMLEDVRATYEKDRQPETLQEASGYLQRLTEGRYRRVWTPLGEDVLRVDDAEGTSLPVEVLSRGAREQLFLCLRLALVNCFARRGARLPLVLDDVLVNFDVGRAKAAATVLRDFAAAGHQVLIFTCHEHILKLFKALKIPVNRLPDNAEANLTVTSAREPAREPARKPRKRKAQPVESPPETVATPDDDEPEEKAAAVDDRDVDEEQADEQAEWEEEDEEEEEYEEGDEYEEEDSEDEPEEEEYENDEYEDDFGEAEAA